MFIMLCAILMEPPFHMISTNSYKKVQIDITTYKKDIEAKMNLHENRHHLRSKFICGICLNNNERVFEKTTKTCPVCVKNNVSRPTVEDNTSNIDINKVNENNKPKEIKKEVKNKTVQTADTDFNSGLTLLNEVLSVFQNKKSTEFNRKTDFSSKNVSLQTDIVNSRNLCTSQIFIATIEENKACENGKFTVINKHQPGKEYLINLSKHKSSSIPQMKLDELKYSLKQKTKSKDAIDEVNRMFATVKRNESEYSLAQNRPLIRNGPRVLPVVKTKTYSQDLTNKCKCCQFKNDCMSSGDSVGKPDCCEYKRETCDKCVYMLCCHYKNNAREMQTGVLICENCSNIKQCSCQHACK